MLSQQTPAERSKAQAAKAYTLDQAKRLSAGEEAELITQVKSMREDVAQNPHRKHYYENVWRRFAMSEDESAGVVEKLAAWREERRAEKDIKVEDEDAAEKEKKKEGEEKEVVEEKKEKEQAPVAQAEIPPSKQLSSHQFSTTLTDHTQDVPQIPPVPIPAPALAAASLPAARERPPHDPRCHPSCVIAGYHPGKSCPYAKRAADEERAAERASKRGKFVPCVGDWRCPVWFFWNQKYSFLCASNRETEDGSYCPGHRDGEPGQVVRVQQPGPGIEERPIRAKYNGDWMCRPGWWNRVYAKYCGGCGMEGGKCLEYSTEGEGLPEAPEVEHKTEAQKTSAYFAMEGRWRTAEKRYNKR